MSTQERIKQLELALCGYDLAINYDYVPEYSKEEIDKCIEDIFDNKYSEELLKETMEVFEGYSDGDMTNRIIDNAEDLIKLIKSNK